MKQPPIEYLVDVRDLEGHRIVVEAHLTIEHPLDGGMAEIGFPSWTPGSYMIRDYARHVTAFQSSSGPCRKVAKDRWRVSVGPDGTVSIRFEALATERSVRTNWLSPSHAFIAPAALFPEEMAAMSGASQRIRRPAHVRFTLPEGWKVSGLLPEKRGVFVAPDYESLVDSAFLCGYLHTRTFDVLGRRHAITVAGDDAERIPLDPIVKDTRRAIEEAARIFGSLPYARYTFLAYTVPDREGMGGLEHRDGCALQISAAKLATPERHRALMGLISHEHFHAWNVKRITESALVSPDLTQEARAELLWFHEGFTAYYDDLLLVRSKVMDEAAYLEILSDLVNTLLAQPGSACVPLREASIDAWIKFYKKNDEWRSASVSYYQQGALAVLTLDLMGRAEGRGTVDGLMRRLWTHAESGVPLTETSFLEAAKAEFGPLAARWFDTYIEGAARPDLEKLLAPFGISIEKKFPDRGVRGIAGVVTRDEGGRCLVEEALHGFPGRTAGLSPKDEIIAVDGLRLDGDFQGAIADRKPGDTITLSVFRGAKLLTLPVELIADPAPPLRLCPVAKPRARQRVLKEAWLSSPDPVPARVAKWQTRQT